MGMMGDYTEEADDKLHEYPEKEYFKFSSQ